jgi:hypothetical protein
MMRDASSQSEESHRAGAVRIFFVSVQYPVTYSLFNSMDELFWEDVWIKVFDSTVDTLSEANAEDISVTTSSMTITLIL